MLKNKLLIFTVIVLACSTLSAKDSLADLYACIEKQRIAMDTSENYKMFRVYLDRFTVKMDFNVPSIESKELGIAPFNSVCLRSNVNEDFSCTNGWGRTFTYNMENSTFVWSYNSTEGDDPGIAVGSCERF